MKTRIALAADATPEQRAAYWASLSKRERVAMFRSGNVLMTTSHERSQAVQALRQRAGGS
jgi:hypothetical protein